MLSVHISQEINKLINKEYGRKLVRDEYVHGMDYGEVFTDEYLSLEIKLLD